MKKPQRNTFKLNPVAAAIAMALASQFASNVVYAGSGFGSGVSTGNVPMSVPTFYANSPSGPAPALNAAGAMTINPLTNLPAMTDTGKALRKFQDTLPGIGAANANNLGQYIPVAQAEKWVDLNGTVTNDDYYEIAAVEYAEKMHSDLPKATHLRGYVQLMTPGLAKLGVVGKAFTTSDGQVLNVVDNPHHLGPIINSVKGTAVRVKFTNMLPVGGKLFIPVDTTLTGAAPQYTQNRAEIHLVGGQSPWISAGTPHQWVAPAGEAAAYAAGLGKGASAQNVPDMADPGAGSTTLYFPNDMSARFMFYQDRTSGLTRLNSYAGLEAGYFVTDPTEQAMIASGAIPADQIPLIIEDKTFVPANVAQQDARWTDPNWGQPGDLWFPHVYEPNQDPASINGANPVGRWDYGPLFWPIFPAIHGALPATSHTPEAYMDTPVINGTAYPTLTVDPKAYRLRILNASNDRYINLGLYKADGTVVAPQLDQNGNPIVDANGIPQTFTNTEVKMIPAVADVLGNPANWDAVNNVQLPLPQFPKLAWNINAEPSGPTRAWPTDARAGGAPDPTTSGPDFIVIGNDGGFLPNPVDIPSQPVTYEMNRRSITVGNIYGYGMLLGPAERADAIVDFSAYAGQTLILYNDGPAPAPFNDPRNDYYTGDPDQTGQGGAYSTKPGYGPNTRTMMQIKVSSTRADGKAIAAYAADALSTALPAAYGASQQHPTVPAVAYNAAFGTTDADIFAHVATGSAAQPTLDFTTSAGGVVTLTGLALVSSGGVGTGSGTGYLSAPLVDLVGGGGTGATASATVDPVTHQVNGITLLTAGTGYTSAPSVIFTPTNGGIGAKAQVQTTNVNKIAVLAKAEQELFDDYGRYNSTGGVELPLTTATVQTTVPLNYIDSATDILGDNEVQIWKLVDNGFWSNSIHFDMVEVQLVNRVGWDGTVKPPATNEVGWKDTVRLNPLEDAIVAMRAKRPTIPFGLPQSSRLLDPSKPLNTTGAAASGLGFTVAAGVVPALQARNVNANFDNEFSWGSAILGHAENDFTRPVVFKPVVTVPDAPSGLGDPVGNGTLTWTDPTPAATPLTTLANVKNEIGFKVLQGKAANGVANFAGATVVPVPANVTSWNIPAPAAAVGNAYQVVAYDAAGTSVASNTYIPAIPPAPTGLAAVASCVVPAVNVKDVSVALNWADTANSGFYFVVSQNGTALAPNTPAGTTTSTLNGLTENTLYNFSVVAQNSYGTSTASTTSVTTPVSPALAPTGLTIGLVKNATLLPSPIPANNTVGIPLNNVQLSWTNAAFNAVDLTVTRNGVVIAHLTPGLPGTTQTYVDLTAQENVPYSYVVTAVNAPNVVLCAGASSASTAVNYLLPLTAPLAPTNLAAALVPVVGGPANINLTWQDNAYNEASYTITRAVVGDITPGTGIAAAQPAFAPVTLPANSTSYRDTTAVEGVIYTYTVSAVNGVQPNGTATTAPIANIWTLPIAPSNLVAVPNVEGNPTLATLDWKDNSYNELSFEVLRDGVSVPVLATLGSNSVHYVDTTLPVPRDLPATHTYQVDARDPAGASYSNVATAIIPIFMEAPTFVSATPNTNNGTPVRLVWTDHAPNESAYTVEVSTNGGASWTLLTTIARTAAQMTSVGANVTYNAAATVGVVNTYRVTAIKVVAGVTYHSLPATINADLGPTIAPSNLTFAAPDTLNWTQVTGATGYIFQQSLNGGAFTTLQSGVNGAGGFGAGSYQLLNPPANGNNYQWQVLTYRFTVGNASTASNIVVLNTRPAQSTAVAAAAGAVGSGQINVNWTNTSNNITSWTVERRIGAGAWAVIPVTVTNTGTTYSFTDTGTTGTTYSYRVMATSLGGNTAYSAATAGVRAP